MKKADEIRALVETLHGAIRENADGTPEDEREYPPLLGVDGYVSDRIEWVAERLRVLTDAEWANETYGNPDEED